MLCVLVEAPGGLEVGPAIARALYPAVRSLRAVASERAVARACEDCEGSPSAGGDLGCGFKREADAARVIRACFSFGFASP